LLPGIASSLIAQLESGIWISLDPRMNVSAQNVRGRLLTRIGDQYRVTNSPGRRFRADSVGETGIVHSFMVTNQ
jgi:hypothetical protein